MKIRLVAQTSGKGAQSVAEMSAEVDDRNLKLSERTAQVEKREAISQLIDDMFKFTHGLEIKQMTISFEARK